MIMHSDVTNKQHSEATRPLGYVNCLFSAAVGVCTLCGERGICYTNEVHGT